MKHQRFALIMALMLVFSLFGAALPAVAQTNDDGGTWSLIPSGTAENLEGVWGNSASGVFAVGHNGAILHYDGKQWSLMTSDTPRPLLGVWGNSSSDVFAVGLDGTILHYDGKQWSLMTSGVTGQLNAVWGSSSSDVSAVGKDGTILHYDGSTWSSMTSGTETELRGVWGSSSTDVFAVGNTGTILHYGVNPRVTGVSIGSGDQGEMLDVVITGAYFTGATAVSFGPGITVNDFTVDSSTQITADIGIAADAKGGTRDISVTTPAGTGTLASGFTVVVLPPTVTKVDVGSGVQGETLEVVISGTYFSGATAVSFGFGITVNTFTVDSSTRITTDISIAADAKTGIRDVLVTTPAGSGTLAAGFTVALPPPTITGLGIASGDQGRTLDVVITGTYFTGATAVSFGPGITVNSFTVDSSTHVTATISIAADATVGPRDVVVTTPAGTGTLDGGFTVEQVVPSPTEPGPETEPTPKTPGGGLSCERSPGPQSSVFRTGRPSPSSRGSARFFRSDTLQAKISAVLAKVVYH